MEQTRLTRKEEEHYLPKVIWCSEEKHIRDELWWYCFEFKEKVAASVVDSCGNYCVIFHLKEESPTLEECFSLIMKESVWDKNLSERERKSIISNRTLRRIEL